MSPRRAERMGIPGELHATGRRQSMADARFAGTAQMWLDMYDASSLRGIIHQRRLSIALSLIDSVTVPGEARALDVGCGPGVMAIPLARRGARVVGVDRVGPMLDLARSGVSSAGVGDRVELVMADASELPFSDGAFDLVVGLGLLMWLPSPSQGASEMARVLEPGGFLLVNASNRWRLTFVLDPMETALLAPAKRSIKRLLRRAHLMEPTGRLESGKHSGREFRALIRSVGLEPVASRTFGFGPFTLFRFRVFPDRAAAAVDRWLQRMADRNVPILRSLGAQQVILAHKPGAAPTSHAGDASNVISRRGFRARPL
jgi:ubiquinone/menaquinone biosynthesis C-methylase UbiE